jgi:hypothetical protein
MQAYLFLNCLVCEELHDAISILCSDQLAVLLSLCSKLGLCNKLAIMNALGQGLQWNGYRVAGLPSQLTTLCAAVLSAVMSARACAAAARHPRHARAALS